MRHLMGGVGRGERFETVAFTRSNLLVARDQRLVARPVASGLSPMPATGAELIDRHQDGSERVLPRSDERAAPLAGTGVVRPAVSPYGDRHVKRRPRGVPMTRTMRALVGGAAPDWEVRDVEVPTPGPGQILVRVRAAGLNRGDLYMLEGTYNPNTKTSHVARRGSSSPARSKRSGPRYRASPPGIA
jgi:hypothetical protein